MIITLLGSTGGSQPSAPTIGIATAGDSSATVAFTASSYIGKGTIIYIATSTPDSLVASSATSPITFSGLNNGISYTFTVKGATNYSVESAASAASNAVVPAPPPPPPPGPPTPPPPTPTPPPVNPCAGCPAAGAYVGQNCEGTYLQQVYADGCCGQYVGSSAQVNGYCGYAEPCSSCVLAGSAYTHVGCTGSGSCVQIVYTYTCAPAGCAGCNCPPVYNNSCQGPSC